MILHVLASRNAKVPKALLICLIFCGVRTLSRLSVAPFNSSFYALKKRLQDVICLFKTVKKVLFATKPKTVPGGSNNLENGVPPPTLSCSSMSYNHSSPGEHHGPEPPQIPHPLSTPASSRTVSPAQDNIDQTGTQPEVSESPQSPEPFTLHPPEPFFEICTITPAQLVPRRWPVSREEPKDLPVLYTNNLMTPQNATEGMIPPYTFNFNPDRIIPGWTTYLHPQGPLYYYNEEKNVVTNANIFEDDNVRVIESTADQLFQMLVHDGVEIPPDTQLVVDLRWDQLLVGYYFASLQGRCVFWGKEKHVKRLFKRVEHVWSHSQIAAHHQRLNGTRLHYQYFPHVQILPPDMLREIKGFLLYTTTDQIFNTRTTSEYSADEVDKALSVINAIPPEIVGTTRHDTFDAGYYLWIAGCIMALNALHRFDNHHGQPNARWVRDDFLYDDSEERSRAGYMTFLSPILFYTPESYYHSLRNIMNDGSLFFEAWRTFVVELHQEWNGLIIIATVLLATNMAFLAIPSIDDGEDTLKRSPAQISSYLSIIMSVSSIALGQLFSRYHRIKGWEHFDERITQNFELLLDVGCSRLAILYSLPYAFLSWSLIAFLAAFLVMCFDNTQRDVRLIVGVPSAVIMLVMVYSFSTMRDSDDDRFKEFILIRLYRKLYSFFRSHLPQLRKDTTSTLPGSQTPSVSQISNV